MRSNSPALALAFVSLLFAVGCNTADIKIPPPVDSGSADCGAGAEVLCDASTSGPSCTGSPDASDDAIAQIPVMSIPIGCEVKIHNPIPDSLGECLLEAECTCAVNPDGGNAGIWGCAH